MQLSKACLLISSNPEGKDTSFNDTHPKMKASLIKLGFTISKDNKEILLYKL